MTITAKIIADSVSKHGQRLTTMQLRYPRFIHAEFMTHRVFSRNASSSRAIPVERLIQDVLDDTAMPIHWGKNQPGMQAREEHDALVVFRNDAVPPDLAWTRARDVAVNAARQFSKAGYHKQIVNRLLEPFSHINVVVTATEWDNFFTLRHHPDAQPEINELAVQMLEAMWASKPKLLDDEFAMHLPYVSDEDMWQISQGVGTLDRDELNTYACRVSAARCARVSYLTHEGKAPDARSDLALFDRLAAGRPQHLSPMEHQARPEPGWHANFYGWRQFRKDIEL